MKPETNRNEINIDNENSTATNINEYINLKTSKAKIEHSNQAQNKENYFLLKYK